MSRLGDAAMNRRTFILGARLALGRDRRARRRAALRSRPASRSRCVGRGPDVILIPGLTAGREVWRGDGRGGARLSLSSGPGRGLRRRAGARQCARARSSRRSPTRSPATSPSARPRPARDRRPFDGRHAGDDDRRAAARAGRPDHGRRHAAAARRPVRRQRAGHGPARRQPRRFLRARRAAAACSPG